MLNLPEGRILLLILVCSLIFNDFLFLLLLLLTNYESRIIKLLRFYNIADTKDESAFSKSHHLNRFLLQGRLDYESFAGLRVSDQLVLALFLAEAELPVLVGPDDIRQSGLVLEGEGHRGADLDRGNTEI